MTVLTCSPPSSVTSSHHGILALATFKCTRSSNLRSLVSRDEWAKRVLTFNPTWFACAMGTGAVNQVLLNFPFNAYWLQNLAYCFWIVDIILVVFFLALYLARIIKYPHRAKEVFNDPANASPLGAIPISIDTIAVGICSFYNSSETAVWVAYTLWWVAISLSILVACIFIFALTSTSEVRPISNITGVYLLAFIPFIVASATGSSLASYLPPYHASSTIFVSFVLISFGLLICTLICTVYTHRILTQTLVSRDILLTSFIPIGPFSMSAYSIQGLAAGLPHAFSSTTTAPPSWTHSASPFAVLATIPLLAVGTFFLLHALAALVASRAILPARFTPALWAIVFPLGVYADGMVRVGEVLGGLGGVGGAAGVLKWVGAVCCCAVVLAWAMCAVWCIWRGVWKGEIVGSSSGPVEGGMEKEAAAGERCSRESDATASSLESQDTLVERAAAAAREGEV